MLDRQKMIQEINKQGNRRMRERYLERFTQAFEALRGYAETRSVPVEPKAPHPMPLVLDFKNLRDPDYHNYTVRKYLALGEETLKEFSEIGEKKLTQYHVKKLLDQEKALRNLLSALGSQH